MLDLSTSNWGHEALEEANFGVLVLDGVRIHFVNSYLAGLLNVKPAQLINKKLFKKDLVTESLLDTPEAFPVKDKNRHEVWLRRDCSQTAEFDVYFFHDITDLIVIGNECRRLQSDLNDMSPKDQATGMMSYDVILQMLEGYISRCRRYQNTLSLMRISYSFPGEIDATLFDRSIKRIAFFLKDQLRWADQIGMLDKNTFLVILPETDYASAMSLLNKFNSTEHRAIFAKGDGRPSSFSIGLTEWKKGEDTSKMLQNIRQDVDLTLLI